MDDAATLASSVFTALAALAVAVVVAATPLVGTVFEAFGLSVAAVAALVVAVGTAAASFGLAASC